MASASINGIRINYEIHGKEGAPWTVWSHSLACSVRMWDPQIAAFKDKYRMLVYDMRGRHTVKDWTPGEPRHLHIGNHGGTHEDEMLIPLIAETL